MFSKIDYRILVVAAVVVGLISGYFVNDSLVSTPKIENLKKTVNTQQDQINNLNVNKTSLESELSTLQNSYNELESSITTLNQKIEDQASEINAMNDQINALKTSIYLKDTNLEALNVYVNELSYNYSVLEAKYLELYNPTVVEFDIDSIHYKLTVSEGRFTDTLPIEGTVEISYSNGEPFDGTFKLEVTRLYIGSRFVSQEYTINGYTSYKWTGAFISGFGSYRLNLNEVLDNNGDSVAPSSELKNYGIYLFVG